METAIGIKPEYRSEATLALSKILADEFLLSTKTRKAHWNKELLADHESLIIHLRENINRLANDLHDAGTSDFITGLMETHEKMAWMLRAHLK